MKYSKMTRHLLWVVLLSMTAIGREYNCGLDEDEIDGDTFVLFYDSSSTSRKAKKAFRKVENRADERDADFEFIRVNVDKNSNADCEEVYSLDEIPTVVFFEDGDTESYHVLEGKRITTSGLTNFVKRRTGVRLGTKDYDNRGRRRSSVNFGIGIGTPYWGGPYYGRPWGWGGWRGHRGRRRCRHCH